jgi:hypothetical protein
LRNPVKYGITLAMCLLGVSEGTSSQ